MSSCYCIWTCPSVCLYCRLYRHLSM